MASGTKRQLCAVLALRRRRGMRIWNCGVGNMCADCHEMSAILFYVSVFFFDILNVQDWCVEKSRRPKTEMNNLDQKTCFSPMPPSEGLKMLVSTMMTGHDDGNYVDGPFEMATWDVSRAHFYGEARRWIYTFQPEGHEQEGKLARLCRSMYGTRDAASIWGDTWSDVLKESSMKVGTVCPAFFCSCDGDLKGLCHGDDFCVVARQKQLQTFGKVLEKRVEVKRTGHIDWIWCK